MDATSPYVVTIIAAQRQDEMRRAASERRLVRRLARRTRPATRSAATL